jgi:nucleoside-diphosphate-sugar epimerase
MIVCVTGGSGFVAGHVCKQLIDSKRFKEVRATTRTKSKKKTGFLEEMGVKIYDNCDLTLDKSFEEALKGCDYVHHCASPFTTQSVSDPEKTFVRPAVDGTLNIMRAAERAKTVKRVILTSSCAAVTWGHASKHPDGGHSHVWSEDDWQTDNSLTFGPYRHSKSLAERAAWDFVRASGAFELVVICPSFVLGPVLNSRADASSIQYMISLLNGKSKTTNPITYGTIDVRDVAKAHVAAMYVDLRTHGVLNRFGQARFIVSSEVGPLDVAKYLRKQFSSHFSIPSTKISPKTHGIRYNNQRARRFLNIQFRDIEEQICDGARSLISFGLVRDPRQQSRSRL